MGYILATPPLIEQWANNLGGDNPTNGSWMDTVAMMYGADLNNINGDTLSLIAKLVGVDLSNSSGDLYQDIARVINPLAKPFEGSWLGTIVNLTTPQ